jgi:hypothetical protein
MVLKEIRQIMDSSTKDQKPVAGICEHCNKISGFVTTQEFLSS